MLSYSSIQLWTRKSYLNQNQVDEYYKLGQDEQDTWLNIRKIKISANITWKADSEPADLNAAFKDLSLLNVQQMIDFNTATTVYDSIHGNCPEYLADMFLPAQKMHNHQTWHAQNELFPSHISRVAGQRSFLNRGCHLWNSLPHSLKNAPTAQCFETNLFKIITGTG